MQAPSAATAATRSSQQTSEAVVDTGETPGLTSDDFVKRGYRRVLHSDLDGQWGRRAGRGRWGRAGRSDFHARPQPRHAAAPGLGVFEDR